MGTMNELINAAVVESLRQQLDAAASVELPATARPTWTEILRAAEGVDGLNLRARSDLVSAALITDLPNDYATIARIVRRALDNPAFTGWMMWPVTETVTTAALASDEPDAFDDGLRLLAELTPRLTGEFAIRRFLAADLDRSLETILPWTAHPNEHVRRLASEGTRAFLPWAIRVRSLLEHPEKVAPILTALRDDESEYVRRSVANHLNDLGRQSPALATRLAGSWLESPGEHTAWVVRHGLRVLIKKADPAALALLGFDAAAVEVSPIRVDVAEVRLPGSIRFSFELTNTADTASRLAVDYLVHYVKANGAHSAKVFKLGVVPLQAGETITLSKSHAFRQMTTRVHYPGAHFLQLQINGVRHGRADFDVLVDDASTI
jgi:3-methyladenine DNA glycosylase AlkC